LRAWSSPETTSFDEHTPVTYSLATERTWRVSHDAGDPHVAVGQNKPSTGHCVDSGPGTIDKEVVQLEVTQQQRVVRRRRQRAARSQDRAALIADGKSR